MITKNYRKNFLLGVLMVAVLVAGFWLIQAAETEASNEIYCYPGNVDSCKSVDGTCTLNCSGFTETCTVNGNNVSEYHSSGELASCNYGAISCKVGSCLDDSDYLEGDPCKVRVLDGITVRTGSGNWDTDDKKCVICAANNVELSVCGSSGPTGTINLTEVPIGSGNWQCSGAGDAKFEYACDIVNGASASCDEQDAGFVCEAGKACDANGKCVTAAAVCGANPQVTASPPSRSASAGDTRTYTITIKNNDEAGCSNRTFNLTASGPSGWPTISLDKASTASLSPGGSDTATLTVKSKSPESDGIYVISVIATDAANFAKKSSVSVDYVIGTLDCPTNYEVEFTSVKITNEDNYILNIGVNSNEEGEVCVYQYPISGASRDMVNPGTFTISTLPRTYCANLSGNLVCSNYDTGVNTAGYGFGTYRVTINPSSVTCNYNSPCFDTVEVVDCINNSDCTSPATCVGDTCVGASACTAPSCNGTTQYCSGGSWVNCPLGQTCSAGVCRSSGGGVEICAGGADEDGDGDVDCADSDCAADPACCTANGGACAENSDCCSSYCTSANVCAIAVPPVCDPTAWFFCNPLKGTVDNIVQAGETLLGYILGLIGSIALLVIIISGAIYMTSAGSEEKISTSKRILTGAVIGLIIALLAYSLLQVIISIL